jgi:hypothetical protein
MEVLICDREEGIVSAFLLATMRLQRCRWHGTRDLKYILYADGAKKEKQKPFYRAIGQLPMEGWTQVDFEELTAQNVPALKNIRNQIVRGLNDLSAMAAKHGYQTVATYLQNLAQPFVTCLDHYIDTGKTIPITPNIIERQIGLFKNRYSRICRRWSEDGLMQWFAVAIRKLLPQFDWKKEWGQFFGNKETVQITLEMCTIM